MSCWWLFEIWQTIANHCKPTQMAHSALQPPQTAPVPHAYSPSSGLRVPVPPPAMTWV